jgi:hypothetical protein
MYNQISALPGKPPTGTKGPGAGVPATERLNPTPRPPPPPPPKPPVRK